MNKKIFKWRGHGWTRCDVELINSFNKQQEEIKKKIDSIYLRTANKKYEILRNEDTRFCAFCGELGDGDQELTGRLLNLDANEWVHVNCALWSAEVHVTEEGALINVDVALRKAQKVDCKICNKKGASIRCYKLDCINKDFAFHLRCAKKCNGHFLKDKTFFCPNHEIRQDFLIAHFDALKRIFIQREENSLLSKIFNHSYSTEMLMRVGSLIFHKIGQLLPEQLKAFTTSDYIFPIGYKVTRIFWSISEIYENDKMFYECLITENEGKPNFIVKILSKNKEEQKKFFGEEPTKSWEEIQELICKLRENTKGKNLRFFPKQLSGEVLFGFAEPAISKMLESLPGIDQIYTYTFKHGGTPLMDLPLAENPSGCARCEPCFRTLVKRKHKPIISNSPNKMDEKISYSSDSVVSREGRARSSTSQRYFNLSKIDEETRKAYKTSGINERMLQSLYFRNCNEQHTLLITQYREMKKEWKENIYLARSKIQGLGLYAKRDLDMNQMIIEYLGEMIRNEVCEMRQKRYIEQNRGEYMFRIDVDWVVDATMAGGLARYINHSCDPNCGTKILTINDESKIVIFANRPIKAGEELIIAYFLKGVVSNIGGVLVNASDYRHMLAWSKLRKQTRKSLAYVVPQIVRVG
uniref:Histone-lysine N-methyltransferase n=2 Tax=Meloidogyne TaxID=189290 RepID=A0A915NUX8_9BILA